MFSVDAEEALQSLQKKNHSDDVIRVISAWAWRLLTESLCYKLGIWSLKGVGVYQAENIKQNDAICCMMGNVGHCFCRLHLLRNKGQDISYSAAPILIFVLKICVL